VEYELRLGWAAVRDRWDRSKLSLEGLGWERRPGLGTALRMALRRLLYGAMCAFSCDVVLVIGLGTEADSKTAYAGA
jgi:hypothetical protein